MPKLAKIVAVIAGLGIALLGSVEGMLYIARASGFQAGGIGPLAIRTTGEAIIALSLGLGLPLAWQGLNSLRGRPSQPFLPWPIWALAAVFITAVAAGQAILSFDLWSSLLFPTFHILAAALPSLIILSLAGSRLAGVRWRDLILQLANGAFLATFAAVALEALSALFLMLIAFIVVPLTPGGAAWLGELSVNLRNPAWFENLDNIRQLLFSPVILAFLASLFVVIAPLIEELLKPLGVVIMSCRRPVAAQAFFWGLAGGAGFALVEGLFSGAIVLEGWSAVMLMRLGGTAMHCLGGGLMGLGWHYLLIGHRPWPLLGAYAASVGMHAVWNAISGGIILASLAVASASSELARAFGGLGILLLAGLLALQTVAMISLICWITRKEL